MTSIYPSWHAGPSDDSLAFILEQSVVEQALYVHDGHASINGYDELALIKSGYITVLYGTNEGSLKLAWFSHG
jgi:hypothetical protein